MLRRASDDATARLTPQELEELVSAASWIGAAETFRSGAAFVDRAAFWRWMSDNYPGVAGRPGGWSTWIASKPKSAGTLLSGKVQEWDWVRDFKTNPLNIGKLAHVSPDPISRHDATIKNIFTSEIEKVESKFASSRASAASSVENATRKPGIKRLVGTPEVVREARARGLDKNIAVQEYRSPAEGRRAADARAKTAPTGPGPGVTFTGTLGEMGRGAVIGAAVSITISTVAQFRSWRAGRITSDDFRRQILHDAAKGATKGAVLGGINVGVQVAAVAVGVGAPVTIPVMVVFGVAVDRIIDPAFGEGEYREVLERLGYQTDIMALGHTFGLACQAAYDAVAVVALNNARLRGEFDIANTASGELTARTERDLKRI
jgi:hypothetical protein